MAAGRIPGFNPIPALAADSASTLAADPRRPQYHYLPPAHWMNDPNGPIYWKGNYHLFYQYNPHGTDMGVLKDGMNWGHAISPDMIHWKQLPIALSPTQGGPDQQGCWTGSTIAHGDSVAALYTGVVFDQQNPTIHDGAHSLRETQCLATSNDPELKVWTKRPQPVIAAPPAGMQVMGFRDPSPFRFRDWYYTTVGTGIQNSAHQPGQSDGAILLYRSKDLIHWEYQHLLTGMRSIAASGSQATATGGMWECPEFFPLDGRHVLIYSTGGRSYWLSGELDREKMLFHPTRSGVLDYGAYYAPKSQLDKNKRRILWGWIKESRSDADNAQAGWACMFSLPRVLTLDKDGELRIAVADDVNVLRRRQQSFASFPDEARNKQRLRELLIDQASGEILCTLRRPTTPISLSLVSLENQTEKPLIEIHYNPADSGHVQVNNQTLPIAFDSDGMLELHLYIDGSVIEFFVNHQSAYTNRFYYSGAQAPQISPRFTGKWADIQELKVWQMAPISPDRLTT